VDKRYERSWLRGLRRHFTSKHGMKRQLADPEEKNGRLVRRGDVIAVPIWRDRPVSDSVDETDSDCSDTDDDASSRRQLHIPTTVGYFIVTSLSFEPLVPIEEDFRSSVSSKSRAGEFGCWVDVGIDGTTKMVLTGLERTRIASRQGEKDWHGIPRSPTPFSIPASTRLRDLLRSCFSRNPSVVMQLSILLKGSNGAGKTCMLGSIADELGYSVVTVRLPCTMIVCSWSVQVNCYDIIGDTPAFTQGSLLAAVDRVKMCGPAILFLKHIEALAKKSESSATGKQPVIVTVLEDIMDQLRVASREIDWPCVLVGSTVDIDAIPGEVLGVFKQEIALGVRVSFRRLQADLGNDRRRRKMKGYQ
jgi:peroxin-6